MANREKLTDRQTACFCRGLSLQLHAGIGLADGIYLLAEEETGAVKELYLRMGAGLDRGEELSGLMEESGCFPEYAWGMVRIGQRSGRLEQALNSLYGFYDRRDQTVRRIRNALSYPVMVFGLMIVVIFVLLVKVLPVFDGVYRSLGSSLTGVAGWLLYLGQLLERLMPVLLAALTLGAVGVLCYRIVPAFRLRINGWYQKRFADRGIGRKFHNARFAEAMAMGLSSGLTMEESLELAENLLKPVPAAARRCRLCAELLQEGVSLSDAMKEARLLPPSESRMLAVGLRGGTGDRVMEEIARRLARQAEEAVEDAVAGIEPALVLTASLLVGAILLTVMLPLMNMMSAIG